MQKKWFRLISHNPRDMKNNNWRPDEPGKRPNIWQWQESFIKLSLGGDFEDKFDVPKKTGHLDSGKNTTVTWTLKAKDAANNEYDLGSFTVPYFIKKDSKHEFKNNVYYELHNRSFKDKPCVTRIVATVLKDGKTEQYEYNFKICRGGSMGFGAKIVLGLKNKVPQFRFEQMHH